MSDDIRQKCIIKNYTIKSIKKNATRLVNGVKLWSNVNKVSDFLVSELLLVLLSHFLRNALTSNYKSLKYVHNDAKDNTLSHKVHTES